MQDLHSIGSGASGAGGDRRFRPHAQQALKCPRCDSLNTKFCYYNNYNLSQPRYFCKSCRRYWTKGGVLRNVPVGGGCRKTKRSNSKYNSNNPPSDKRRSSKSQNSSSDSSSLTANTTATATVTTAEVLSASNSTNSAPALLNFDDSSRRFFSFPQSSTPNQSFDPPLLNQYSAENNLFSEIGTFTSLMTSSTDPSPFEFNIAGNVSSFRLDEQNTVPVAVNRSSNDQPWMHTDNVMGDSVGFMDQTAEIELSGLQYRINNGGLEAEDQALFDLTEAVDQSYWGQTQWNDHQHDHDYFP